MIEKWGSGKRETGKGEGEKKTEMRGDEDKEMKTGRDGQRRQRKRGMVQG